MGATLDMSDTERHQPTNASISFDIFTKPEQLEKRSPKRERNLTTMQGLARMIFAAAAAWMLTTPVLGAKRVPPPVIPPTVFASSYHFDTAAKTYPVNITVPSDGAWFFGTATYGAL